MTTDVDVRRLRSRCLSSIGKFDDVPGAHRIATLDGRHYLYVDRGAPVLAVAHLDTVGGKIGFIEADSDYGPLVISKALDDRLGAYILLDYLPMIGIKDYDILLTVGEESGTSTAMYFEPSHGYNWLFSFDRHGTDTVMYEYEEPYLVSILKDYDLPVGQGSFSDICFLDHLGVVGFNFGVGYRLEHSDVCHAYLTDVLSQVRKFAKFFYDWHNEGMPYDAAPWPATDPSNQDDYQWPEVRGWLGAKLYNRGWDDAGRWGDDTNTDDGYDDESIDTWEVYLCPRCNVEYEPSDGFEISEMGRALCPVCGEKLTAEVEVKE